MAVLGVINIIVRIVQLIKIVSLTISFYYLKELDMKVTEFYEKIEQDYGEILDRMIGKEELLIKFLKKYTTDRSFEGLKNAVPTKDSEQIFRAAHTLKGVASNLGLRPIVEVITPLVESARKGNIDGVDDDFEKINKAHNDIIDMINTIE